MSWGGSDRHLAAALGGETGVAFVSGDAGSGKTVLLEAFAASAMAEHPGPAGGRRALQPRRQPGPLRAPAPARGDALWRSRQRDCLAADSRGPGRSFAGATTPAWPRSPEQGPDLVDMLVPAASIARRADRSPGCLWPRRSRARPAASASGRRREAEDPSVGPVAGSCSGTCSTSCLHPGGDRREQPLLLLFDDLHWVDDAQRDLSRRIWAVKLSRSRILVLGAYRSATVALGRRDPRSGEMSATRSRPSSTSCAAQKGDIVIELDRADGRAFVEAYVDTEANRLGARFRDALYAQTGGHALFTVESLRNLQARGELFQDEAGRWVAPESLDWGALPARVEAAIAERIDRLPEAERRILSAASVQGDDFTGEMVAELTGSPVPEVICLPERQPSPPTPSRAS